MFETPSHPPFIAGLLLPLIRTVSIKFLANTVLGIKLLRTMGQPNSVARTLLHLRESFMKVLVLIKLLSHKLIVDWRI